VWEPLRATLRQFNAGDATMEIQTEAEGANIPRLAFTPKEAAKSAGVAERRIFKAIADERLQARKDGKATLIEVAELARWISSLPTRGRQQEQAA
jgi:hypothetical protein